MPVTGAAQALANPSLRAAYPLWVASIQGDQATMGHQLGALTREAGGYEDVLGYYPKMPRLLLGRREGALLAPALQLLLRRLERRRPSAYRERSRAFFKSLGRRAEMSRNVFVMDLLQNAIGLAGRLRIGPFRHRTPPACSSLAVWGSASEGGSLRHARNFDFPGAGLWERWPAVVFCAPVDGLRYGYVTTRGADVPGVTAFNEAGLVLTAHTCFHCEVRFDGVGIVDLGHELIRSARCIEDAIAVARARPVASTWNLLVSSASERRAVVLEVSAQQVRVIEAGPGEAFLPCTNRYRSQTLQAGQLSPAPGFIANSDGRLKVVRHAAARAQREGGLDVAGLMALLGSNQDPADPAGQRACGGVPAQPLSVQSVVCEPEARRIWVSLGECPTGKGPYVEVPWRWEGVGQEERVPRGDELTHLPRRWRYDSGPHREAYRAYVRSAHLSCQGAPLAQVEAAIREAVGADPYEPGYRLSAGGFALRGGDFSEARAHFERGLETESCPFRRGQLHLWASRAAAPSAACGEDHRAALLELEHPQLERYQAQARREATQPLGRRRLRRVQVNLDFPDLLD